MRLGTVCFLVGMRSHQLIRSLLSHKGESLWWFGYRLSLQMPMYWQSDPQHQECWGSDTLKALGYYRWRLRMSWAIHQWQDRMRSWNGAQPSSPEKSQQQQLTRDACFRKAGARGSETWSKPSKQAWRAADGHSRATILASTSSHSGLGTELQTCALRTLKPCVPTALHKANQEDYKANKEEVGNWFGEIDWCQNGLLVHTQGLLQWLGAVSNNSQHYRDFLNPMISLFRGPPPQYLYSWHPTRMYSASCLAREIMAGKCGRITWREEGGESNLETAPVEWAGVLLSSSKGETIENSHEYTC